MPRLQLLPGFWVIKRKPIGGKTTLHPPRLGLQIFFSFFYDIRQQYHEKFAYILVAVIAVVNVIQ